MQTTRSSSSERNCKLSRRWASERELIAFLPPRNVEKSGPTDGLWRGARFALLFVAPFYLLGIYLWFR